MDRCVVLIGVGSYVFDSKVKQRRNDEIHTPKVEVQVEVPVERENMGLTLKTAGSKAGRDSKGRRDSWKD